MNPELVRLRAHLDQVSASMGDAAKVSVSINELMALSLVAKIGITAISVHDGDKSLHEEALRVHETCIETTRPPLSINNDPGYARMMLAAVVATIIENLDQRIADAVKAMKEKRP